MCRWNVNIVMEFTALDITSVVKHFKLGGCIAHNHLPTFDSAFRNN
jgi:hypothetical protein